MDTMAPSPRRRRFALPVAVTAALTMILGAGAGVGAAVPAASAPTTLRYGDHDRQVVTVYRGAAERPPLAVYIHGGAWRMGSPERVRAKPQWFGEAGWAFASVGYRVLPDAQVEEQAQDVAAGLRALRADAARLGFDPDRILIMGHSAGAHLAALVATDGRYLGADRAAVRGVILLDGAGYDVSNEFNLRGPLARKLYGDAFGEDPARQRTLSPIAHVDAQDPPDWLIVFAESRVDAREQAAQFGDALQRAGLRVERIPDPGNHMEINREFGTAGYRANAAVRALMSRVAGQG
jgi:acetyl esterase/lipase